ncbi:NAD-binding protein [Synechocystis sp. FACHB-383]|uniref:NAD(P)-binding protein n=1 Tax=Synechocystis sp. FACHB-383 TaxID=2692864 RepID=UPI001687C9E2|nr:NAD(P)-binding protein [Synechocystis sp. FACHB-383]MBD2653993.1 NAD-binding protein [Synechocystis sp. FACHB-383]
MDYFLVCGLGYLGQHCVVALKKFGVKVIAIEKQLPPQWEIKNLDNYLDQLIIGDCSQSSILLQLPINHIRAALIVTTIEKINIETAITIRALNPQTRLVVRSVRDNLNSLLSNELGNFVAYEPKHLPANAYALSALGKETISLLNLGGLRIRINRLQVPDYHHWLSYNFLDEINNRHRRILSHNHQGDLPSRSIDFHCWHPEAKIQAQDTIIYVETEENYFLNKGYNFNLNRKNNNLNFSYFRSLIQTKISSWIKNFWSLSLKQQVARVAIIYGLIVFLLLIIGTILFSFFYPGTTLLSSFYVTAILLLGGYSDLFDSFEPISALPEWLQLFSLALTVTGTAFVGVLYALLTQALLSSKFQFYNKRPPIPKADHVVIIGLGKLGQEIANKLRELKINVLGITFNTIASQSDFLDIPLIYGHNLVDSLQLANLETASSVIVVTDDDIVNIETALLTQKINPCCQLVIRTNGDTLTKNLGGLLPAAIIIDPYVAAAEVFTGAAFGENILGLSCWQEQTVLVTQYYIEEQDTLQGLLIAEVAYGYGVVPIIYQEKSEDEPIFLPSEDRRLIPGNLLIVLATIAGLKAIEAGDLKPKQWNLKIIKASSKMSIFDGITAIARIAGCPLKTATETMNNLPATLPFKMYYYQAMKLKKMLQQNQIETVVEQNFSPIS